MAFGVLQLHDTPWLHPDWDSKDVGFIVQETRSRIALLDPPYVSHSFHSSHGASSNPLGHSAGRRLAKNALIFALGIALLELSYGQPLVSLALPNELDAQATETPQTEMLVATRLIKGIRDRESDNYALATASCVQCDMGYPFDYSLEDSGFRSSFIERVVSPLQEDYDRIFS